MKRIKLYLLFVLVVFFYISLPLRVSADGSYRDWKQYEGDWSTKVMSPGSDTIKKSGCTTVAMSILLKHSGLVDSSFTPSTLADYFSSNGIYDSNSCLTSFSLDSLTNGNFKCLGDSYGGASASDISEKYNAGYFVLICMYNGDNQHWIACLDAKDPSNIIVADPGSSSSTTLSASQSASGKTGLRYIWYESTGKKANELSAMSDTDSSGSKPTNTDQSNLIALDNGSFGIIDPMSGKIYELTETAVELPDRESLKKDQLKGVTDWKNNIDYENSNKLIGIVRVLVSFSGILFLVWMILIYLCYWVDRINNLIDIEFLPIITMGKLKVSPEENDCSFFTVGKQKVEIKTVNHKAVIVICIIGIACAVLIITGKVYDLLTFLVRKMLNVLS